MLTLHNTYEREPTKEEEIFKFTVDRLREMRDYDADILDDADVADLHNTIFNTDYYIVGRFQAKEWLGEDTFEALGRIVEYEKGNFGEVTTDLSEPEHVANMYVYILGWECIDEAVETIQEEREQAIENALEGLNSLVSEGRDFADAMEEVTSEFELSQNEQEQVKDQYDEQ